MPDDDDDDGLFRHPLSWRSRIFRATVALILLVLAVRLVWGWQAQRALEAKLAELRRLGEPVEPGDVAYEQVPDAENAWHYQMKAAAALVPGAHSPAASNRSYNNYPPFPDSWWKLAEASERANSTAFSLSRQARKHASVQFRKRLTSPVMWAAMPKLDSARTLANTVGDGALYAHLTGNDAEALDRAMDVLHLARSLYHDDFTTSQLYAIGIEALALERIEVIAPGLRLRPDTANARATRDRVNQLIRQLLDEEPVWHGLTGSLQMEQLATIDETRAAAAHARFIHPLADRQILRDLRNYDLSIQASRLHTKPKVEAVLANLRADTVDRPCIVPGTASLPRYSRCFNTDSGLPTSRYIETAYRVLGERRVTTVSLAVQLYRADHSGDWPGSLADLAPAYLPAVPADPYYDDGRPLGYVVARLPDGTPRPLVYFGAGDAANTPILAEPMIGWQSNFRSGTAQDDIRQYRDLSRFTPPPPSTKAVEDDPEEPDAPRNDTEDQYGTQLP